MSELNNSEIKVSNGLYGFFAGPSFYKNRLEALDESIFMTRFITIEIGCTVVKVSTS